MNCYEKHRVCAESLQRISGVDTNRQKNSFKNRDLLRDILRDPFEGIGKPEPLKYQFKGYWSRRIDHEHRLIYSVTENSIVVMSCYSHYQ